MNSDAFMFILFCFGRSIDDTAAGDYLFNLLGPPQTEQRQREHSAFWDEEGKKHAKFWKNFWPPAIDILVKVASSSTKI